MVYSDCVAFVMGGANIMGHLSLLVWYPLCIVYLCRHYTCKTVHTLTLPLLLCGTGQDTRPMGKLWRPSSRVTPMLGRIQKITCRVLLSENNHRMCSSPLHCLCINSVMLSLFPLTHYVHVCTCSYVYQSHCMTKLLYTLVSCNHVCIYGIDLLTLSHAIVTVVTWSNTALERQLEFGLKRQYC